MTEDPGLADAVDEYGWSALRIAALAGSEKVVAVLLKKNPHALHTLDTFGETPLHIAASRGHVNLVEQLLATDANAANVVNCQGWTPLHCAASNGWEVVVDMLLVMNPQLIFVSTTTDGTVLQLACASPSRNKDFFLKLLTLNPKALRAKDSSFLTALDIAVAYNNEAALEVLQWQSTFAEVVGAFAKAAKSFEEWLMPIMKEQCACLVVDSLLNRDVLNIVFEYLGFTSHSPGRQKRARLV